MLIRTRTLKAVGWTARRIRAAVDTGRILRVRTGAFCEPATSQDLIDAARARGRLACVSELRRLGVFVLESDRVHVHLVSTAARMLPLRRSHRLHRRALLRNPHPDALAVEPLDAVYDAVLCQTPRAAVATIDSALHRRILHPDELDELLTALPRRGRRLRRLLDARAESGPESLMRLILRSLGCSVHPQCVIPGVGRVDFLVDGWLIVECDSEAHHAGWPAQRADRRRDQAAAALGLATYRPVAEDILWHGDTVRAAVAGLLASRRGGRSQKGPAGSLLVTEAG